MWKEGIQTCRRKTINEPAELNCNWRDQCELIGSYAPSVTDGDGRVLCDMYSVVCVVWCVVVAVWWVCSQRHPFPSSVCERPTSNEHIQHIEFAF